MSNRSKYDNSNDFVNNSENVNRIQNNIKNVDLDSLKISLMGKYNNCLKDVETIHTTIDVLTDDRIIVVQSVDNWIKGIGLLNVISLQFKNKIKHLHLYDLDNNNKLLNQIMNVCRKLEISLSFGI